MGAAPRLCRRLHRQGRGHRLLRSRCRTRCGGGGTVAADRRATTFAVAASGASGVAFPHAHSGDNPEADWGRHVRQAAEFGLQALADACPDAAPFTFDNTCVIAVGLSNGGGAVLRAAEEGDWLDAVVAAAPNVCVAAPGARSLFDYATEAALWMPAAFPHLRDAPHPLPAAQGVHRGASLHASGVVDGVGTAAQARVAYDQLRAAGWEAPAVQAGALSVRFGLWRAVAAAYASAYGRFAVDAHPCGFRYAALDADGAARPATATERASWWSDAGGIPPGAGIGLIESPSGDTDAAFAGLLCLRGLQTGGDAAAQRVQQGVAGTRAGAPRAGLPIVIVHGDDDGLIPPAFSSAPYVAQARAAGGEVAYWRIARVQHFDSFLALPECGVRYRPLLPYIYAALDRIDAALNGQAAGPRDASIAPARASGLPLTLTDLAIPAV
ncbi:D-(-)-3-hydroxybutyrate oligomer hydrolase [Luteimonas cellulosilyticus]|uniref:D-(-)-3-hydroxybutyrate oligomer hydrolase n=1 Tax=Luteimonas cellulosilyticus TaxID=2683586 RepID=UPI00210382CA|nr:D-(-)-3-hydroxybutyrate oligomer hydrolase [Luteimonas cellulosilyticus]